MTETKKKTTELSVVDQMAEDANPPDYPEGAPDLVEYRFLFPRRKQGEFYRKLAAFQETQTKLNAAKEAGLFDQVEQTDLTPEQQRERVLLAADAADMYDHMDELLGICAADPDAYNTWTRQVDNEKLAKVFEVFIARSQLGEADSSTS